MVYYKKADSSLELFVGGRMKIIVWWSFATAMLLALGMFYSSLAWTQDMFPEGRGKETMFLVCVQCHSLSRITAAKMTADDWEFTLYDMIARGAPVYEKDIKVLKKYLINNYAVEE